MATRQPRMTKPFADPPKDVKRMLDATAARIRKLDAQGWFGEITRIRRLSSEHKLGLHREHSNIIQLEDGSIGQIGGPSASFLVDLNMPDELLKAQFDRWLDEARKLIPSPVPKPGRQTHNGKFDETTFERWRSLKIVEFAELLAWRAGLPEAEQKISKATLGKWIGRNSSKDVTVTEKALKKALASLPALGAQLGHEMSLDDDKGIRQRISARIAKEIER